MLVARTLTVGLALWVIACPAICREMSAPARNGPAGKRDAVPSCCRHKGNSDLPNDSPTPQRPASGCSDCSCFCSAKVLHVPAGRLVSEPVRSDFEWLIPIDFAISGLISPSVSAITASPPHPPDPLSPGSFLPLLI